MPKVTVAVKRLLRHLLLSSWNNLGRMALQAQSDTDRPPSAGTPAAPGITQQPDPQELDQLPQETDNLRADLTTPRPSQQR